jgi:hypothetical protein
MPNHQRIVLGQGKVFSALHLRCTNLFGHISWRWRVIRTSNAYVFRDQKCADCRQLSSKSENPSGTQDQEYLDPVHARARNPEGSLERALARFGAVVAARKGIEQDAGAPGLLRSPPLL